MRASTISNAMIVCPKSVVRSWEREANLILKNMCVPKASIYAVTSDMSKEKRKRIFTDAFTCSPTAPRLVITTYVSGDFPSTIACVKRKLSLYPCVSHYPSLADRHRGSCPTTSLICIRLPMRFKKITGIILSLTRAISSRTAEQKRHRTSGFCPSQRRRAVFY